MPLSHLSELDQYARTPFPPGWALDRRTFWSPVDQVHQVLVDLVHSAQESLVCAMYGFDDDELAAAIHSKLVDGDVAVQLTLDRSQAGGVHERLILAREQYPASSIAVGSSERGRIMHMKMLIIDGIDVVDGSTNLSQAGEGLQDNQLTVTRDPIYAARARARVDAIHHHMVTTARKAVPR